MYFWRAFPVFLPSELGKAEVIAREMAKVLVLPVGKHFCNSSCISENLTLFGFGASVSTSTSLYISLRRRTNLFSSMLLYVLQSPSLESLYTEIHQMWCSLYTQKNSCAIYYFKK